MKELEGLGGLRGLGGVKRLEGLERLRGFGVEGVLGGYGVSTSLKASLRFTRNFTSYTTLVVFMTKQ